MFSIAIKALLLVWPFLKRAIFRDRTVVEVLLENKHVTFIFSIVLVLLVSFLMTVNELNDVRSENLILKDKLEQKCECVDVNHLSQRKKLLDKLLK